MPTQEPGTRKARALPYEFFVHGRADLRNVQFMLDFANTGTAGAAFYVIDRLKPQDNPRRYTVSPGDKLSDHWLLANTEGAYDLAVYGPNGSLCCFQGVLPAVTQDAGAPEARLCYDVTNGNVILTLTNAGTAACDLTVGNAYSKEATRAFRLPAGASQESTWPLDTSARWYDLTVKQTASSFMRRFAGHVETGKPGTSDPGPLPTAA